MKGQREKRNLVPREADITRSIRDLLKTLGVFHWKNWGGPMGTSGIPDILGIWQGKMLGIEVKRPGGIVAEHQKAFLAKINAEGGIAFVARSVDDVIENLKIKDRFLV